MIRKKFLLLLATFVPVYLLSAQQLPSTLLWKISGNGLQKSSYLYGTMHLTDERIFNLGDSLYKAIEHSDGFAIEVDPEEFTPLIIDETKKSAMEPVRLKDMMQQDKFKKYGKLLSKRLHKKENDITTDDILREKNKWIQESYRTGRMKTFLDTYLFDIARREGKWTGGVEDAKDQAGLLDMVDESDIEELAMNDNEEDTRKAENAYGEYFINVYIKNDLNAIDSLSNLGDSVYEDALLVKRNKKMAMRMDSLSHERSMVFAVGAAHLPGDKGLIALLKEKGFSVTPVFSSKKIKPADYKVAEVPLKWYNVRDKGGLYTVSMPGKPGTMVMYDIMNMQMYFDVFSSTIYMTTAIKTPYTQKIADSVFGKVASYYFGTSDYKKGKPVTINKTPGREFLYTKKNYSHGYLLFKDGQMYIAVAMCMKKDTSAAKAINRFLHSFAIIAPASANGKGFTYINKEKAYQVQLPAPPQTAKDLIAGLKDSTISRDLHISADPVSGAYLFFGTNEAAPGYYLENDSSILAGIKNSQEDKFANLSIDTMYIHNGIRMMDFKGLMAAAPLMMRAHYQFRGNRWYALVAMYDTSKDNTSVELFFNSFATLNYTQDEWKSYASGDNTFYTWAPMSFSTKPSIDSRQYIYKSYDSSRGDTYSVVLENFSKYYWQNSDSSFWEGLLKQYKSGDSILLKREISNGGSNGYELEIQEKGSANVKRVRILLNGGKFYTLLSVQAASEINNPNCNKFFDSFRFNNIQPNTNLFVSKAPLLLNDVASKDSDVASNAIKYLNIEPFTKNELPLLHQALLKKYPTDEDDYDDTKNKLKQIIINFKDTSSFIFAKSNYTSADDTTRNILLTIMASFPTREHFNEIKNILLNQTPRLKPGYDFSNALTDSIQLAATILPDLLPLLKDTVMASVITRMSWKLSESDLLGRELLHSYQPLILQLSQKNYAALKANPDDYRYVDYDLANILGKINTPEANTMLQKWSLFPLPYFQLNAVNILLHNKQSINPHAIQVLAKNKNTRIELYDSLKAYRKQNLFPVQYLTQRYFAESLVYTVGGDDDPFSIIYLNEKVLNFKGRRSKFYFYKVAFGDSTNAHYSLGCAGPFSLNVADISLKDATGAIYEDEEFVASKLLTQIDTLITQMQGSFEWKDKKIITKID